MLRRSDRPRIVRDRRYLSHCTGGAEGSGGAWDQWVQSARIEHCGDSLRTAAPPAPPSPPRRSERGANLAALWRPSRLVTPFFAGPGHCPHKSAPANVPQQAEHRPWTASSVQYVSTTPLCDGSLLRPPPAWWPHPPARPGHRPGETNPEPAPPTAGRSTPPVGEQPTAKFCYRDTAALAWMLAATCHMITTETAVTKSMKPSLNRFLLFPLHFSLLPFLQGFGSASPAAPSC